MQLKLYQQMIFFRTYTLNFIQIHLIYAKKKKKMLRLYKHLVYYCYVMLRI